MCQPASFIVTENDVLWKVGSNHHEDIIDENRLKDDTDKPDFVRVEVNPPEKDGIRQYNAPLKYWKYKVDQDYLPKWYVESVDKKRVMKVLPAWYESHIIGQITDAKRIMQQAGYRSTQTAGMESTQKAGDWSTQTAGDWSTQKSGMESTQTAGNRSTQTAGAESTQKAGNQSTQTAGLSSVQIGYWHDNDEYKTVCRVVTEKEANKPYLFKCGVWTEVKKEIK